MPIAPDSSEGSSRVADVLSAEAGFSPDQATVISQRPPGKSPVLGHAGSNSELGKHLTGERLNHFQLLAYVGGGGMGAVFRAAGHDAQSRRGR